MSVSADKLQIIDYKRSDGAAAEVGHKLTIKYAAALSFEDLDATKYIDDWWDKEPITFTLGAGQILKGLAIALVGMRVGSTRRLWIPPELAFGKKGVPSKVPPDSPLVFDVYLVRVE
jgi:FKBP-type peptidyl-prolyl cis-trans isomerase